MKNYFDELANCLISNNISQGDIVYIGTDISPMLYSVVKEYGIRNQEDWIIFLNMFIDCLQKVVGKDGTLLIPLFTWKFCDGVPFDYKKTTGEIGAFPNYVFCSRTDFKRTKHPIYGFLVWGKDSDYLASLDNQDSFEKGSPFGYLHKKSAKQINFGVPISKCGTFLHYVEQMENAPYRYKKFFMGKYFDEHGNEEMRVYSMNVRDLSIQSQVLLSQEYFVSTGAANVSFFRGYEIIFMSLDKMYEAMSRDLNQNCARNLYTFSNYSIETDSRKTHYDEIKTAHGEIIELKDDKET